jgi:hypothetical protein
MKRHSIHFPSKILPLGLQHQDVTYSMKKFAAFIFILLPCLSFGQLFPKIPDFKGNIEQIVEKKYGKESNFFGILKANYHPKAFSGWKYTYQFDENSKLIRETTTKDGKIQADYLFQHDKKGDRIINREITSDKSLQNKGDYLEYENFINANGQIEKVNFWAYNSKECSKELFLVEQNVNYKDDKLVSFIRQNISLNGDTSSTEKCSLFYNSSGQLIRIERKNIETDLTTILYYIYNNQGFIDHYSVDYLSGLSEFGKKNKNQEIYYTYDQMGNWTMMYRKLEKKNQIEAKRKIRYRENP